MYLGPGCGRLAGIFFDVTEYHSPLGKVSYSDKTCLASFIWPANLNQSWEFWGTYLFTLLILDIVCVMCFLSMTLHGNLGVDSDDTIAPLKMPLTTNL
ncbi:hypothetical protein BDV29DRAFT_166597 [Aspergillus leporis]|jgi:hypothetical protein|uniref:Uncharacterized protein n=1 Tax=Aspergillus leporis TaxID=41062 RepID=A0A5N5XCD3_9EURO|nr:hypothetical protein BDV29DRAFT_166597 [Aspergillus leporis]